MMNATLFFDCTAFKLDGCWTNCYFILTPVFRLLFFSLKLLLLKRQLRGQGG